MFRKAPRLLRCPARFHRPLKTPRSNVNLVPGRTNIRSRSPRCTASSRQNNVGKGSRQIGSVTSGKGLALRAGPVGPGYEAGLGWARAGRGRRGLSLGTSAGRPSSERGCNLPVECPSYAAAFARGVASAGIQQPTQNWYGPGESDCLIKTKHCDGRHLVLTQCDFCPVL